MDPSISKEFWIKTEIKFSRVNVNARIVLKIKNFAINENNPI